MFYRAGEPHGLPHDPFKAIVSPRPIAWISTRGAGGDNLSPYSFFNAVAGNPPQLIFSSNATKPDRERGKDTLSLIEETGVFCVNIAGWDLREEMNASSAPYPADTDEFEAVGLEKAECQEIDCPRVAAAPASLECHLKQVVELDGDHNYLVIGRVVAFHLADAHLKEGIFDVTSYRPLSRLGYMDFASVDEVFSLPRPKKA